MADSIRILGLSGSLRRGSYNSAALCAAVGLAPPEVTIEPYGIGAIPLYDGDVEAEGLPPPVIALREAIRAADGVLIATPEYNYSIPGVLKNAIDWASRPAKDQPFSGKPVAIMGASPGALGTARAQYHLRQVFVTLNGRVLNKPEVMIASCHTKFDDDGVLTDEDTAKRIRALVEALAETVRLG